MQVSADSTHRRSERGFTLLEIMVTVGLIGVTILPILQVREEATNRAFRTSHMMRALHHAQELLAHHARDIDQVDQFESRVEDEPAFRYELTLEDWDLGTGRPDDEEEDDDLFDERSGAITPSDAGTLPEEPVQDDPHLVRRFRIKVFWPDLEDDEAEESLMLEGFLPRMWEEQSPVFGEDAR